jgi:hypothetical protein
MKNTPHILTSKSRIESEPRAVRNGRNFPRVDHAYQNATLRGSCGTATKFSRGPSFYQISNKYFADEAARTFLVDTGVFAALILTALLPIVNSVQAVATLIHSVGVL